MTHAIGTGTCNIAVNVPVDERSELGRLACSRNQSVGELVRHFTMRGIESELAECEIKIHREIGFVSRDGEVMLLQKAESLRQTLRRMKEIRIAYYGGVCLAVFIAALVFDHHQDLRRCRRGGRNQRTERIEEVEA